MSLEDRMLERYTREQQRGQGKKGMYNLEDEDPFGMLDDGAEDGAALGGLTHGGRNVMDLKGDDFEAQGFGEDDDDDDESNPIRAQRRLLSRRAEQDGDEEELVSTLWLRRPN